MTIISFETSSDKSTKDKKKNTFHLTKKEYIIRGQNAITKKKAIKEDPISRSSPVGDPSRSQLSQMGDPWPVTLAPHPWPKRPHP